MHKGRSRQTIAEEEWINDEATRCEIRDSGETVSPQVRLMAAQFGRSQFESTKIEMTKKEIKADINELVDQLSKLAQVRREDIIDV